MLIIYKSKILNKSYVLFPWDCSSQPITSLFLSNIIPPLLHFLLFISFRFSLCVCLCVFCAFSVCSELVCGPFRTISSYVHNRLPLIALAVLSSDPILSPIRHPKPPHSHSHLHSHSYAHCHCLYSISTSYPLRPRGKNDY